MRIMVKELRYLRIDTPFIRDFKPYEHQLETLKLVRTAINRCQTICIENTSVTGSGKTLANFAAAILDNVHTCGIYPTNELMLDQYVSIREHLYPNIAILDSQGMDDIMAEQKHIRSHAHALAWATERDEYTAVLTNPDVLYLAMYDLYGQMFSTFNRSFGERVFRYMLARYPVIAFDEFHLYNLKQIANAAFMMGTAKELAPNHPHIFIFSSATPQQQFKHYAQRLGLEVIPARSEPSQDPSAQVVCEPIEINLMPADLLHWRGSDAICTQLDSILSWADSCVPSARGVFIVDSVYEAKCIADQLRQKYEPACVGEVHGYMDDGGRAGALRCRFSVGTTTIDVGVDLTGPKTKEFLVCEAHSAAQAIQRLGRLGRQGREPQSITVPNRAWLAVPEYVYQYIRNRSSDGVVYDRTELNKLLTEAYLGHENFAAYTIKYSPLEAVAACERIRRQDFEDTRGPAEEKLHRLVPVLYDKQVPSDQDRAEQSYQKYLKCQQAVWRKFGAEIKQTSGKNRHYYLSDLESFRGGMESDFTVAIYDELDAQQGMKPVKTYNLPFVLRRTKCDELSERAFTQLVKHKYPTYADQWLEDIKRQNILGYVHVRELVEGKARNVYFEISKPSNGQQFERVVRLEGFRLDGNEVSLRTGADSINERLRKRKLNCWIGEQNSFKLSVELPPLFAIYPLHAFNPNGKYSEWSIAFGQDAFFLDSIAPKRRITKKCNDAAVFL
jgi:CRISPR-associated endonuclease/helicase Cas3